MDDTVRTDGQSREEALFALIETDSRSRTIGSLSDARSGDLIVQRITRGAVEMGEDGGRAMRLMLLQELHGECYGSVMLAFDGWADDPRPLCQIPIVIEFLRGLLGPVDEWGSILQMFVDERAFAPYIPTDWYDVAGRLWVLAHTTSGYPYWHRSADGRLMRDLERNAIELDLILSSDDPSEES